MDYLIQHGRQLFILVLFPFLGLTIEIGLSSKKNRIIAIAALVLLIPILIGYNYTFFDAYPVLTLIILASGYSFFSRRIQHQGGKFLAALLSAGLLFVVLGYAFFIQTMAGSRTTEKKWEINNYQIEYIRGQGFAGSPLMTYELSKLAIIPIFIKKIETVSEGDSVKNCIINFNNSKVLFNKCSGTIEISH